MKMDKNRFAPLTIPFALMMLFGALSWMGLAITCSVLFFSGVIVICCDCIVEEIGKLRPEQRPGSDTPPENGR